jgi:hypothetical protein
MKYPDEKVQIAMINQFRQPYKFWLVPPQATLQRLAMALAVVWILIGMAWQTLPLAQAAPLPQEQTTQLTLSVVRVETRISIYTVTNPSQVAVTTAHYFYAGGFPDGQVVSQFSDSLAPLQTKVYALGPLGQSTYQGQPLQILDLPNGFVGDVVITANQPVEGSAIINDAPASGTDQACPPGQETRPIACAERAQPSGVSGQQPSLSGDSAGEFSPIRQATSNGVRLNWTLMTYLFIGLFVLSGFFKGWWKESVTTFFLALLILLLQFPIVAEWLVLRLNEVLGTIWGWILVTFGQDFGLGDTAPGLDVGNGGTWLAVMLVFLGLAILISRSALPSQLRYRAGYYAYAVNPLGAFLGGLLGGLNGFLIINLVREYLTGTNLPVGSAPLSTEIASAANNTLGIASSGVDFRVTDLPSFTILTNPVAWLVVAFGVVIFWIVLSNRVVLNRTARGLRTPRGYARIKSERKGDKWGFKVE